MTTPNIEFHQLADLQPYYLIVGAGVAGASLAIQLARAGKHVVLVDRDNFPRYKVCGCCLNGSALRVLDQLGVLPSLSTQQAVPIHRLKLFFRGKQVELTLPDGLAISRQILDSQLIEHAKSVGTFFFDQTQAKWQDDQQLLLQRNGQSVIVQPTITIAANGLLSKIHPSDPQYSSEIQRSSRIGAGCQLSDDGEFDWLQPGCIYMLVAPHGYVGMVRLEDQSIDLAAALDASALSTFGSMGQAVHAILRTNRVDLGDITQLPWKGVPALTRKSKIVASNHWFRLGDAAGYVEPFTGEGMAWALTSSERLAELLLHSKQPATEYQQWYDQVFCRKQLICRGVARLLRWPWACRLAMMSLQPFPALATPLIRFMNPKQG